MKMNFSKGWGLIFYCGFMFFFLVGYSIDGLNIIAPAFAEKSGIEYSTVLSMSTIAGLIGILAYICISRIVIRVGARLVSGICLIASGVCYFALGSMNTLVGYAVCLTLVTCFVNGAAYISGNVLVASWFPKKKGLVNGFTTMGFNFGSALYVPLISALLTAFGFVSGMHLASVGGIILGLIGLIFIRNTPQEKGMYPDNVTKEVYMREYYTEDTVSA